MALDFACRDWAEKLARGETPIAALALDRKKARQAVAVFDRLRLPDQPGKPTMAEAAGEWIRDIVRAVWGSMQASASALSIGERAVGEVFILVPKKNGKTTNAAGLAIVWMLLNERPRADGLIIGPTQKIADTAFQQAAGMIEADEWLRKRFHVRAHLKEIHDRLNGSRLMIRTFGMEVLTGSKPVFTLIDEVHILGGVPYAADVIRQIRGGMMPFPEALLVMITTQSDHRPAGVFRDELMYARGVRDGRITGSRMLPVLYEFPEAIQTGEGQPWRDPALWHMVTPQLGRQLTVERLMDGLRRAEETGQGEVIAWATQHLNVEVGLALHADRWIGVDHWPAAALPDLRTVSDADKLAQLIARCECMVAGVDGGGLDDLFALSFVGRDRETKDWLHWGRAWAHPEVLDRRKDIATRLQDFARAGELVICEHPTQDVEEVADLIETVWRAGLMPDKEAIGLDPFAIGALIDELVGRGIPREMLLGVRQGSALSPAVWTVERKLKDGTMRHSDQEAVGWSVGNAVAEQRGNAVLITKQTAGKAKIDPLIALLNAATLMAKNPQAQDGVSVYEDRGILVL